MKKVMLILSLFFISLFLSAQDSTSVTSSFTTNVEITSEGGDQEFINAIAAMLDQQGIVQKTLVDLKISIPNDFPEEDQIKAEQEILDLFLQKFQEELAGKIVTAYMEHVLENYTEDELKELKKFYESDLGKKVAESEFHIFKNIIVPSLEINKQLQEEASNEIITKYNEANKMRIKGLDKEEKDSKGKN